MTRRRTPTPQELVHWAAVADPAAARGTYRWSTNRAEDADGFGWFAYAGDVPAPLHVPPDTDVAFWYEAPGRWRIEVDGGLVGVADGSQAVAGADGHVHVGTHLLAPDGPGRLLHPEVGGPDRHLDHQARQPAEGDVTAGELLGRRCWRWSSPAETWWFDHETGIALAHEDTERRAELLTLELTAEGADFAVPADLLARARPLVERSDPVDGRAVEQERAGWEPQFTVTWWPGGTSCWPERGDPETRTVLLTLATSSRPFWLGIAALPTTAPARRGAAVHRWTGDGWSFALCWKGELAPDDLARVVASVPARWEP